MADTETITAPLVRVTGLDHIVLISADVEASLAFYTGTLGLAALRRGRVLRPADLGLAAEHALSDEIERIPYSKDRLVLVVPRQDELASRRQVDFGEVVNRDFVGLITSSALHAHVSGHAAKLGARLRFRARLNNFDAIGQMVASSIGVAVMPEIAARRCARAVKIAIVRIRDSWADRRLVICARSFKALPKPAQQLVEHLRKSAR